ncbi:apoptotic chromatin condensation inducer 1b [Anguilla anguilla]|uniref:apoptotic chromatin condensation inducer 1b n=1 Tax=Anguilla anguilla TaxID=7936 RepID=UPI0015A91DDC|nr:apoptotic chromatin condensation inducer 1b [Anguilla anguilla]
MKRHQPMEVTQAGSGSVVEAEACSERRGPVEGSMGNSAESPTATTCSAPQISLPTVTKPASECGPVAVGTLGPPAPPAGTLEEAVSPVPASRKRRWDSSTTAAAKQQQPSGGFSSLKSLIPDVPPAVDSSSQQEAVVELHPEEGRLSGDEEEEEQGTAGGLHVQRAVTQMASAGKQENGQKEGLEEEDEEDEAGGGGDRQRPLKEERKDCSLVAMETQAPPTPEAPSKKAPPSGTRVRHSSQQKSGVSLTAEDPVCSAQKPPPPHSKGTNIIHICNLVRPFTLGQLKELLNETGAVVEEGFWIDKIKSHCYVTYPSVEEAVAARTALQGLKWPQTNPRFLRVDFCQQDELDRHRAQLDGVGAVQREGGGVGEWDQQAQRQRERERRERARGEREWDRDKVADFSRPGEDQRSPAHPPERRDQPRTENPPGKLLDDLFCKTKAPPCIYWLPLTEQQALQRKAERAERMKEREKRRKELQQEEDRKREERRAGRSKEAGGVAEGGGASQPVTGEREKESEKVRENEKVRDKENETEKVRGKEDREREEKDKERGKEMGRGEKEKERERGRGSSAHLVMSARRQVTRVEFSG